MINVTSCVLSVLHLQPHTLEVSFATFQLLYQLCAGQACYVLHFVTEIILCHTKNIYEICNCKPHRLKANFLRIQWCNFHSNRSTFEKVIAKIQRAPDFTNHSVVLIQCTNVYSAVILTRPLEKFTRFVWWMQAKCQAAANHQTKPTWAVSPLVWLPYAPVCSNPFIFQIFLQNVPVKIFEIGQFWRRL